jgi:divalent metal cation (Fe/Co/Zn/Cd) transporter
VSTQLLPQRTAVLRRRGFALEGATSAWNVVGVVVLAVVALASGSVALAGFGLDSLIEIGASLVVIWELSGTGQHRRRRALRLLAAAFVALAAYLLLQAVVALIAHHHPADTSVGIAWTAVTALVMFALAAGKTRTGRELGNPVLTAEGRVTVVDGLLAVAVLAGLVLDALLGWWWADPLSALVLVFYASREAMHLARETRAADGHPSAAATAAAADELG